jgi:serine/threonine protein phosphatase PrpC
MAEHDEDTIDTDEQSLARQLRHQGVLGPFRVADWWGTTDIGPRRSVNEDRWLGRPDVGFVVADGMGGHDGGAVAAEIAARTMFDELGDLSEGTARTIVQRVNGAVHRAGIANGFERCGTTLTALAHHRNFVVVVSVGDSRAYRFRDGEIELLTHDHTVRNELADAGVSDRDALAADLRLDALTSFIGRRTGLPIAHRASSFSVMAGDRFMLCTDGVHGPLADAAIADCLARATCRDAATELVRHAARSGGTDNATAVVAEFAIEPTEEPL